MKAPFTIEHIKDGNYLRVHVLAPVTRDLADEFTLRADEEVVRLGADGVLVDVRGVQNISTVHDNVEYSAWDLKEMVKAQSKIKRAVLTDVDDDTHDLPILAMREMGFNAEKFTGEQDAIAWLTGRS